MKILHPIDRWSLLALTRFILCSIVAIAHLHQYGDLGWLTPFAKLGAFEAVLGFLLISGYSVTHSFATKPQHFIHRRILRLYPVYFVCLVFAIVASHFASNEEWPSAFQLVCNALFLNQILTIDSLLGPAWSLSLEFWLYCLLPFLMGFTAAANRRLAYLSLFAYLLYTIMRSLLHFPYFAGLGYGVNLLVLSFIWISGSMLSRKDTDKKKALFDIGVMFLIQIVYTAIIQFGYRLNHNAIDLFFQKDIYESFWHATTLVGVFIIFYFLTERKDGNYRPSSFMRIAGDISYPLYLVHVPLYLVLRMHGVTSPYILFPISVGVAWLLYISLDRYSRGRAKDAVEVSPGPGKYPAI